MLNRYSSPERYVRHWVKSRDNDYGYGFCTEKRPEGALVVYTDVPGVADERLVVPLDQLEVVRIGKGTRVWLKGDPYGWHAAEITDATGFNEYRVRIPGLPRDAKLARDRFVVRWNRPLLDPVKALAYGLCDSPEYYEARRAVRDELMRQRRVSRGFTAVLSAPVELYAHQLDTVARVLSDPVPRYLLADEVGLGKTIEAGLILRQLLIDDAEATALVSVPASLVQQWRSELVERVLLGEALSHGRIQLVSHERLTTVTNLNAPAVVVIDEAHRLLKHLETTPTLRARLLATRGLLLLSATPLRGDPQTFLDLLNLIDPTAFPRHDIQTFENRVSTREKEATSLEVLTSSRAGIGLRSSVLDELEAAHGTDPVVTRLVAACRATYDVKAPAWLKLVDYVRETYRISRRMIRHRRNTDTTDEYPVAGREARFVEFEDPARVVVDEFLDRYRDVLDESDAVIFGRSVVNGLGGPTALLRHLQRRLGASATSEMFVPEPHRALFRGAMAQLELANSDTRMRVAFDLVADRLDNELKVVVVSTSTDTAKEFCAAARARWPQQVGGHFVGMPQRDRDRDIEYFLGSRGGRVLVGDYTLEEGRNLQDAHVLVNLDLPLDPNRLEQRIGRLDRFAQRAEPAEVVVLVEPSSDWVASHVRLLDEGIGIFTRSVATLQHRLNDVLEELARELLLNGSLAFEMDLDVLREHLEDERTDVDLLEELESVTVASDFDQLGVAELREAEADPQPLRTAFTRLTSMRGGLNLLPVEDHTTGVVKFDSRKERVIFGLPQEVSTQVIPLLRRPRTYARSAATSRTGVSPLRLGDPLVDWLEQYLRFDERGRARAVVRPYHGVTVPTLWLSCDFLVEFDASHLHAETDAVRRRLRRRGDALLPPVIERTWTDSAGPAEPELVAVLEQPYSDSSDRLLKGPEWRAVLAELPDWQALCDASAESAWHYLRGTATLTAVPAQAAERASAEVRRRLAILEARSQRLPSRAERESARRDLDWERRLGNAMLLGVREPAVSVVACGAVVLWPST